MTETLEFDSFFLSCRFCGHELMAVTSGSEIEWEDDEGAQCRMSISGKHKPRDK